MYGADPSCPGEPFVEAGPWQQGRTRDELNMKRIDVLCTLDVPARYRILGLLHLGRCAFEYHLAPVAATFRTQVDDPIGVAHHIHVVLDDDHRISAVHQLVYYVEQLGGIRLVHAGGGLVHDVDTPLLVELAGQLDALALASRERVEGLTER